MPQDYYSLVTNQGLIKEAASNEPGGTSIDLTEMAVGDSNGAYYDPDGSETALTNEVHRVTLTHVVVDENNTNQLIVEAVLDEAIGPFYIREVGIFDSNGDLFAIGKYPETFKPNLPAGSGKRLYIRMILGFANSPNVNLVINNDIALDPNFGTDVNNALAERLVKTNNLSDLDDISTARNNLDVYDKSYLNTKIGNNYIINGNFDFWQRGFNFNEGNDYGPDRWAIINAGSQLNISREEFTIGQSDVPNNPRYFVKVDVVSSAVGAGISQKIENVKTLSNQYVTISFWAKSDSNINIESRLDQNFGTGGSPSTNINGTSKNHNITNVWQKFTHTVNIPSILGKVLGDNNDDYLELIISNVDNEIFTLYLSQIQIESGQNATGFKFRHLAEELSLCQRFYEKSYNVDEEPSTNGANGRIIYDIASAVIYTVSSPFKVTKRSVPSITIYDTEGNSNSVTTHAGNNRPATISSINENILGVAPTNISDRGSFIQYHFTADSEL